MPEKQSPHLLRDGGRERLWHLGFGIKLKLCAMATERLELHFLPGADVDRGRDRFVGHAAKPQLLAANISPPIAEARHLLQKAARHGGVIQLRRRKRGRSEEHTSELQSPCNLVCRLLLEKKKT